MKKILLIICLIFCIFFINVDVNARYVCNLSDGFEIERTTILVDKKNYEVMMSDVTINLEYDKSRNVIKYSGNYVFDNQKVVMNFSINSGNSFTVSKTLDDNLVGHFGTAPINSTSNQDLISFCYNEVRNNLVMCNEGDLNYNNVQYDCSYVEDGVGEKIEITEDKPAEDVVDENGNVDLTKKQCTYHIFGKYGYDASEAKDDIIIYLENDGNGINITLGDTGNRVLNSIDFIKSDILNTYNSTGNCLAYFYVDEAGIAYMSNNGQNYYDRYELGDYKYSNYTNKDTEPETSPLWPGIAGTQTCDALDNVNEILQEYILKPMRYLVPIIFLIMTSFDFAKSVFGDDKSGIGKAKKNLIIRIVVSILVFFVPNIVEMLFNLFKLTC